MRGCHPMGTMRAATFHSKVATRPVDPVDRSACQGAQKKLSRSGPLGAQTGSVTSWVALEIRIPNPEVSDAGGRPDDLAPYDATRSEEQQRKAGEQGAEPDHDGA